MDNFIEIVSASLVVAALAAISMIAYRHPQGYLRIAPWMSGGLFVLLFGSFIWNFSNLASQNSLFGLQLQGNDMLIVAGAIRNRLVPGWCLIVAGLAATYLWVLLNLPKWLSL